MYALVDFLTLVIPIELLIGIVVGIIYAKKALFIRLLLMYLAAALLIDVSGRVVGRYFENNLVFIPLFGAIEAFIFYLIYRLIYNVRAFFGFLLTLVLLYTSFEVVRSIQTFADPSSFHAYARVISSFFVVAMSFWILYFTVRHGDSSRNDWQRKFNVFTFCYFSLSLILFVPTNFLISENLEAVFYFWLIHLVASIAYYALIIWTIWNHGKTLKPS